MSVLWIFKEMEKRAILRTKKGYTRFTIPSTATNPAACVRSIKNQFPSLKDKKFILISDTSEFPDTLAKIDDNEIVSSHKMGLIYVREGQKDEDEIFSNVETSKDFQQFCYFMGEKIELLNWNKYRGGLDVKHSSTGEYSLYTQYQNIELMFHVAPLLPNHLEDSQRVSLLELHQLSTHIIFEPSRLKEKDT